MEVEIEVSEEVMDMVVVPTARGISMFLKLP